MPGVLTWKRNSIDFNYSQLQGTLVVKTVKSVSPTGSSQQMIKLRQSGSIGLSHASIEDLTNGISCLIGYFKWPEGASAPTAAEVETLRTSRVFGEVVVTSQGTIPTQFRTFVRYLRMKPGEDLFTFCRFIRQLQTSTTLHGIVELTWLESQA